MTSITPLAQSYEMGGICVGFSRKYGPGPDAPGLRSKRRPQNELLFAWTACSGMGFPQPHMKWVALEANNNLNFISQQQIGNANYAFAYVALRWLLGTIASRVARRSH